MEDEVKKLKLTELKPYWRNPRVGDVDAVKNSIRDYGYNQFIMVDKNYVIIVGHTRYKALQELALEDDKWKEVPVLVSALDEKKAKEYRIVDNQTGDKSEWILDKLQQEMREVDEAVAIRYFSQDELDKLVRETAGAINYKPATTEQVDKQQEALHNQMSSIDEARKKIPKKVFCPECGYEFEVA